MASMQLHIIYVEFVPGESSCGVHRPWGVWAAQRAYLCMLETLLQATAVRVNYATHVACGHSATHVVVFSIICASSKGWSYTPCSG